MSFAAPYMGSIEGAQWESRVQDYLTLRSTPIEALPGGCQVFGFASLSGLQHQIDLTLGAVDALLIVECKSYRGALPKNELLKFKAVTDDYYMSTGAHQPNVPIIRLFGGPGDATHELRRYAAYHGIVLIDRQRWPVPFLISQQGCFGALPIPFDVAVALARACRPLQRALRREADGSYRVEPPPASAAVDAILALHDRWSGWLWTEIDTQPGSFEQMLERRFADLRNVA